MASYGSEGGIPKSCETRRIGSVEVAANDLCGTVERVGSLADELAARLTPILRPAAIGGCNDDSPDYSAPFAQILQGHDRSFNRIADLLRDLLDRLEI